ncbi:MAG TPA: DUF192 domain-containing protein [Dehalococcoidia bacterium]|nr:DUF192 domain-containing protein [Dehalococcoidia bacterium]
MKHTRVTNRTTAATVAERAQVATDLWSRFWGLMGRRELPPGTGILIAPCSSIHMFFMRFPIDVVFLDRDDVVVKIVHSIRPWRLAMGGGGKKALELPAGTARAIPISEGDQMSFEDAASPA